MDIVSIVVFGLIGLACWLVCRLMRQRLGGKAKHERSQFDGKNDRPPERKVDILGR